MGIGWPLLGRMNLLQRLMLWSASLILAVFACILFFLNLRIVGDMRSLVQLDLTRTRMLFERLHRIRGEDLTTQCSSLPAMPSCGRRSSPGPTGRCGR